ncbi:hypothetical protein LCGC14_0388620 [marine sediment metagenome]|uniref:Macrocin O-methyltransferase n=1 Tax=marine sediment metagenome TaxID=412755 RepID=A0A0F9T0C3_9ZZZZ
MIPDNLKIIGSRAASTFPTVVNSYELALGVRDLEGDIMECGVGAGSQIGAMALASNKTIWAVDSFEGIPMAGAKDTLQPGIGKIKHDVNVPQEQLLKSSGISSYSIEVVKNHIREWGLDKKDIRYVKGWFEHIVKDIPVKKLALLRLDGDLYSSTLVCLEHLYPKLVKGGYLIVDDYALVGCRAACREYFGQNSDSRFITVEGAFNMAYMKI